ncbi:MAG: hypothetical protein ACR2JF_07325 [Iamia sp.]
MADASRPTVTVDGSAVEIGDGGRLTFGRDEACTVRFAPDDRGISRLAGELAHLGGHWWVVNRSQSRPLEVVDDLGFRTLLAPGRRLVLEGDCTVVLTGEIRRHALVVEVAAEGGTGAEERPGSGLVETGIGNGVVVNRADRDALAALFEGYLRPFPRHDPHPRTYAEAAERLGWPRTTLVKRIEHLRNRLTEAGVPGLHGNNALRGLAEYVITSGLVTRQDLDRLPGRSLRPPTDQVTGAENTP